MHWAVNKKSIHITLYLPFHVNYTTNDLTALSTHGVVPSEHFAARFVIRSLVMLRVS